MPKGDFWKRLTKEEKEKILEKRRVTKLKKYGDPNFTNFEKSKQTKLKKYGDSNYNNTQKNKETCLIKYGKEHASQTEEIKNKVKSYWESLDSEELSKKKKEEWKNKDQDTRQKISKKARETKLERYGDPNYKNIDKMKQTIFTNSYQKLMQTDRLKNLVIPKFTAKDFDGSLYDNKYPWECKKCNTIFYDKLEDGKIPRCPICFPTYGRSSKAEKEIQNWLSGFISIEKNKMFDKKYELDIYIPSKKFGIEFNGLFWHSEINGEKDRNYHLNKTEFFENQGIQILHIFEDEWIDKQEIVKSIILSKLGLIPTKIFARKCQIKEISSADARLFYFDNHIQGEVNSKVNIGLYYQNELVSLMSFSKPRFNKNYDWEMTRFCTKVGVNVVGAAGRLLSHFKTTYKGTLISYADRRFSMGKLYEQLGFVKAKTASPDYFYFKSPLKRFHRVQFQKHKLKEKLEIFDPQLTEWQNMQLNGWDRIWDCGNLVFILK